LQSESKDRFASARLTTDVGGALTLCLHCSAK
jgi:hypothetical protein